MTLISNDPAWWPTLSLVRTLSYSEVASLVVVVYDWVLTFGQEVELVWKQRWSLMTVLYLSLRYIGLPYYTVIVMLPNLPTALLTDTGCTVIVFLISWTSVVVNVILAVMMIARLHAMYQQSRKILVFLIAVFLAIQITGAVLIGMANKETLGEELILSGTHLCGYSAPGDTAFLTQMPWVVGAVWEILALCFAIWISVRHFRELQRPSTGWAVGDCFRILVETHVFYFAGAVTVSCLHIINLSPKILNSTSVEVEILNDCLQIAQVVQFFVLGPRLILGVREYHAKLMAKTEEGNGIVSIVFQERIRITTGSGV